MTSACLSRRARYAHAAVSCSERTAHRSAASVMDDDWHGTDERGPSGAGSAGSAGA